MKQFFNSSIVPNLYMLTSLKYENPSLLDEMRENEQRNTENDAIRDFSLEIEQEHLEQACCLRFCSSLSVLVELAV